MNVLPLNGHNKLCKGGMLLKDRLLREKNTVETIITLYCKNNHSTEGSLCRDCSQLIDYAFKRLDCCKFGPNKPVCGKCRIHCYKPDMRESIRNVMRTTGPKLLISHPVMSLFHLVDLLRF
jgi:hypothetical protein